MVFRRFRALALLGGVFGCGGPWHEITFTDEGEVCFSQQGADVRVVVIAPDCLSSSCSRDVSGECSAVVDGATITLTSEITWEEKSGPLTSCTEDCNDASVECSLGVLADGSYTVVHGEDEVTLVVPAERACIR